MMLCYKNGDQLGALMPYNRKYVGGRKLKAWMLYKSGIAHKSVTMCRDV